MTAYGVQLNPPPTPTTNWWGTPTKRGGQGNELSSSLVPNQPNQLLTVRPFPVPSTAGR
ncbi:MAG: hypothetical protein ACRC11_17415 [Xenococcaceae cyanobacterium]